MTGFNKKSKPYVARRNLKPGISVDVRNGNVDKALRILKKKLQEDGLFNQLREREAFMGKGERERKERAAGKRRESKKLQERMENQGY
jgi:small subunit ribosomal protein S21